MSEWISTKQAMRILGVGSTTVKRWADEDKLPFIRTAGGHRRFRRSVVERLLQNHDAQFGTTPEVYRWLRLLRSRDTSVIRGKIERLHTEKDDWFAVADFLGQVSSAIGQCWADGEFSVVDEHIVSARLSQALAMVSNSFPMPTKAPVCLLATLAGEKHTLGLAMTQLCLRSTGIDAIWVGTEIPIAELVQHIRESDPREQLMALSASSWQTDHRSLARGSRDIAAACRDHDIELILGGTGAWPDFIDYGYRCRSFGGLKRTLAAMNLGTTLADEFPRREAINQG